MKNVYFGVIALAGMLFFITTSTTAGSIFGTVTWPVTYQMLELVSGTFSAFMLVIITFYAGELAWREREHRFDQIHDALPIPTWLPFAAKLVALMLVPVLLQAILLLCGIGIQARQGLPPLRARPVPPLALRPGARRLLADLRARADRPLARQPEVSRPLRDDRLLHRVSRSPTCWGSSTTSTSTRQTAGSPTRT